MSARPKAFTVAFYVAFGLWITATRYSGPFFYAWQLAPIAQDVLRAAVFSMLLIVAALVVRQSIKTATLPWLDMAVLAGAIVGFDLVWRFRLLAWDQFKFTSIALDIATPLIVVMGLMALSAELGLPRSKSRAM